MQGSTARVWPTQRSAWLPDGTGLVFLRRLWSRCRVRGLLDAQAVDFPGHYPSGMVAEVWIPLLPEGGVVTDDLRWPGNPGIRRLHRWKRIPDFITFGSWFRRARSTLVPVLDEVIRHLFRGRWAQVRITERVTPVIATLAVPRYLMGIR